MASGPGQYLKDTRAELRHVAWPTRTQTIVYAVLVALISVAVALYLGLFDYIFRVGLTHFLNAVPSASQTVQHPVGLTQTPLLSTTTRQ